MSFLQRFTGRLERLWPSASLRSYLFAVMLLATLPMAALMSLQGWSDIGDDQARIDAELAHAAAVLAEDVERQLASSLDGLNVLAQSELFQHGRIAALGRLLHGRPRGDWDSVFLLDRDGSVVLDTASEPARDAGLAALRGLQRQVAGGRPAVSGLWDGQRPNARAIAVAVPIRQNGQLRYVLGARMGAAVWQRLAAGVTVPAGARAEVFDAQDRLIAISGATQVPAGAQLPRDAAGEMEGQVRGVHRASDVDGRAVYAAWHTIVASGWRVQVAQAAAPIDAAHRRALLAALGTSGASLLLGLLLAAIVARRVAQPLRLLAWRGAASLPERVPVREVALLRDALRLAQAEDAAAHDALRAKAHEFETLFQSSPIGMAVAQDPACLVVVQNAAMDAMIGPRDAHQGGDVRVLHHGRELAPGEQPLERAAAHGETVSAMELEIAATGRPSRFVIANAVPLAGPDGRPRGAISALVDITERKHVEQRLMATDRELRETQRQMELAQEAGRVGFFHYRFGADRLAWTPGQCKLFGVDALANGTLRGWFDAILPADRERVERDFWTACALRRDKETFEYGIARSDGRQRWLSSRVMLQYDADGRASRLVGITVDVTDQVETEHARAQLTERAVAARLEAEAANRAKDEFLTMLGHELRNPLGAIAAASDVLESAEPGGPTALEARAIIARQTRNLAHMMNDLLDVGRVLAGRIVLAREPVNLAAIVQRVHDTLQVTGLAREHPLGVELRDAWVDGDAVRLEQVASNLLTNAIRHTAAGRPIRVSVRLDGDAAVLEVQDAGAGIPATLLPRIFELFVQGERPLDRRAGGLGIGLTLVRRLAELHGGAVGVDSSDQGSRFTVRLPAIAAPARRSEEALPPSRRRKVLVIEDNEDVMTALRAKLELDGHTVSTAADGIEGLQRLLEHKPEVSIVDIGLPGLTGFELARHARAAGYAGRMIAISGYGAERDAQEARVAGFDAYLVKPIDPAQLRASLAAED